jgi:choline dehydrogenase-like flavoprotein
VLDRPNLTVLTGVGVTRLRTAAGRVVGAEAHGRDGPIVLDAGTVILSAGAVASAHLLLLSGIGPATELAGLGIPVVADLAVGQHFSDHPEWLMSTTWAPATGRPALEAVLVTDDLEVRPYTSGFGAMAGGSDGAHPDIGVVLTRPRSRGRLTLVSADPDVAPRIEHRYDSHPGDVADLRGGCDLVTEFLRGATELGDPRWSTSQHLCGTAPMGSVVDARCRVYGVHGLAVIDGSVLRRVPSRGPHAAIAMLAHRASEFF